MPFDEEPQPEGDYVKIIRPDLYANGRPLTVGDVLPVAELGTGVACQLVQSKRAEWRKTPGRDAGD